jgi:hypothetical protein
MFLCVQAIIRYKYIRHKMLVYSVNEKIEICFFIDTVYQHFVFYIVIPRDGPRIHLLHSCVDTLMSCISCKNKTQQDVHIKDLRCKEALLPNFHTSFAPMILPRSQTSVVSTMTTLWAG